MVKRRTWRWVWVTRSPINPKHIEIWVDKKIPQVGVRLEVWVGDRFNTFNARDFEDLTGLIIPTDRPVKVKFSAKVVE